MKKPRLVTGVVGILPKFHLLGFLFGLEYLKEVWVPENLRIKPAV